TGFAGPLPVKPPVNRCTTLQQVDYLSSLVHTSSIARYLQSYKSYDLLVVIGFGDNIADHGTAPSPLLRGRSPISELQRSFAPPSRGTARNQPNHSRPRRGTQRQTPAPHETRRPTYRRRDCLSPWGAGNPASRQRSTAARTA